MSKSESGWFPRGTSEADELIEEVKKRGDKITPEDVIGIMKRKSDGKIIWLENGVSTGRGLAHIIKQHLLDFQNIGIPQGILSNFVLDTIAYGKVVGYQGKDTTRPIYMFKYGGNDYMIAVTIGSNGFVVGANPRTSIDEKERIK